MPSVVKAVTRPSWLVASWIHLRMTRFNARQTSDNKLF